MKNFFLSRGKQTATYIDKKKHTHTKRHRKENLKTTQPFKKKRVTTLELREGLRLT